MKKENFKIKAKINHDIDYLFDEVPEIIQPKAYITIGCPKCQTRFKMRVDHFLQGGKCKCQRNGGRKKQH